MTTETLIEPMTDNSIMPFGKHRGKRLADVPAVYLMWLSSKGCTHAGVSKYILSNFGEINYEARTALAAKKKK